MPIRLRAASPDDAPILASLINGLAAYEKLAGASDPSSVQLAKHLAEDSNPRCYAIIAEDETSGEACGFALFFRNYSTFLTDWGVFLEDLFVESAYRGRGLGAALLASVAERAVALGAARLDWNVLTWNRLARDFYEDIGARTMEDWVPMRLEGDGLLSVGASAESARSRIAGPHSETGTGTI